MKRSCQRCRRTQEDIIGLEELPQRQVWFMSFQRKTL
nr:MAG TPA: Mediator complex subunit 16 [Caudoviricetes sp.]